MRHLAALLILGVPIFLSFSDISRAGPCAEARAGDVLRACYARGTPPFLYGHSVLGETPEWGALEVEGRGAGGALRRRALVPAPEHIFEDVAPRLADMNGDGHAEVIVVESHRRLGARLAILDLHNGRRVSGPHIGTRYRWLAPVGAADLDGDGAMEVAWVDRPHLARVLRVWRWTGDGLREIARLEGVTNHRIGEPFITSGIRQCGDARPEMVLADAGWRRLLAVRLEAGRLRVRDIGRFEGPASLARAMRC